MSADIPSVRNDVYEADFRRRASARHTSERQGDGMRPEYMHRAPRPAEKSDDIKARLAAKRADDPTSPSNILPLRDLRDIGERPPTLVAVPAQATSTLAEFDRGEANGIRVGLNRAEVAVSRVLHNEVKRLRERGTYTDDDAYLEGIERALDTVRELIAGVE
jgi:hypothetical protein